MYAFICRVGAQAVAGGLPSVLRYQLFNVGFGALMFLVCQTGPAVCRGELRPAVEALISTLRTASSRGFGGLTPQHSRGRTSPLTTDGQSLFSGREEQVLVRGSAGTRTSNHFPPPVIDRTADRALAPHILCWSWAVCFSVAPSSENVQGSINLASSTAPPGATRPSSVAAIRLWTGCRTRRCTSLTALPALLRTSAG
jgi:hypothetical protein